jgi:hypothetical protein
MVAAEIKVRLKPNNCLIACPLAHFTGHEGQIDAAAIYS